MEILANIITAFILGVLTPLTAVCVLPLYPGFLSYLANQIGEKENQNQIFKLGLIVASGVIVFMMLLGLIFTAILQVSLTKVIGVISPIAFGLLGIISIFLIFDFNFSRIFPHFEAPKSQNPKKNAFLFGFFFGAIIIPCNPLFIAALFTTTLTSVSSFVTNFLSFIAFGFGISAPLILLSALSLANSKKVTHFLTKNKRTINLVSGLIMLGISLYYLLFVFRILPFF